MADKKISALTAATTPLAGTEVLPIVQGGATVKVSVDNLTTGKPVSMSNLTYTGTLTGGTGVINIGSGQVYKDASGNVGLGTSSPAADAKLQVHGNISQRGDNTRFFSYATDGTLILEQGNGSLTGDPLSYGIITRGAFPLLLGTNTAERFRIDVSGNATLNTGNLVIGTAGKGIDFSADGQAAGMTSELLDDYEEGTFTPTVTPDTGTITSFTLGTCNYTKVGRMVTINFSVTITDAGTGAGFLNVSLPFTNGAAISNGTGRENGLTGAQLQSSLPASSAVMNIRTYANVSVINTNAQVRITMTYFV